jgi:hypothetical protein
MAESAEKRWYVRGDDDDWRARELWRFENQAATRMFVTNPESGPGSFFKAEPARTSWLASGAIRLLGSSQVRPASTQ